MPRFPPRRRINEITPRRLTADEERALAKAAKDCDSGAWEGFNVCEPVQTGTPSEAKADARWVLTGKVVEEGKDVEACLAARD